MVPIVAAAHPDRQVAPIKSGSQRSLLNPLADTPDDPWIETIPDRNQQLGERGAALGGKQIRRMQFDAFLRHPDFEVAEDPEDLLQAVGVCRRMIEPERQRLVHAAREAVHENPQIAPFAGAVVFADDAPVEPLDRGSLGLGSITVRKRGYRGKRIGNHCGLRRGGTIIGGFFNRYGQTVGKALEEPILAGQFNSPCALESIG